MSNLGGNKIGFCIENMKKLNCCEARGNGPPATMSFCESMNQGAEKHRNKMMEMGRRENTKLYTMVTERTAVLYIQNLSKDQVRELEKISLNMLIV